MAEIQKMLEQMVTTKWAIITVDAARFVSREMLRMFEAILSVKAFEDADHGIRFIRLFDDNRITNGDEAIAGECYPLGGTVVISLEKCLQNAVEKLIDYPFYSVFALYYMEILITLAHEAYHCTIRTEAARAMEDTEEGEAENFSLETLISAGKHFNLEPPAAADEPYFIAAALEMIEELGDEELLERQKKMLGNRQFMAMTEDEGNGEDFTLHTFKQFLHFQDQETEDDPAWTETPPAANVEKPGALVIEAGNTVDAQAEIMAQIANVLPTQQVQQPVTTPPVAVEYDDNGDGAEVTVREFQPNNIVEDVYDETEVWHDEGYDTPEVDDPEPQPGPEVMVHPDHGFGPEKTKELVWSVFNKVYSHMFDYLFKGNPMLEDPSRVRQFGIQLTPEEQLVVPKMDCQDINGKWCPRANTSNGIFGLVSKDGITPYYHIYINNGGVETKRVLLPQNPKKLGMDGQFTKTALMAQQGNRIMHILNADTDEWAFKCINGVWE